MTQHHHASDSDTIDPAAGEQAPSQKAAVEQVPSEQATGEAITIDPDELKRLSEAMAHKPQPRLVAGRAARLVPVAPALGCFHGPDQIRAAAAAAPLPYRFRRIG